MACFPLSAPCRSQLSIVFTGLFHSWFLPHMPTWFKQIITIHNVIFVKCLLQLCMLRILLNMCCYQLNNTESSCCVKLSAKYWNCETLPLNSRIAVTLISLWLHINPPKKPTHTHTKRKRKARLGTIRMFIPLTIWDCLVLTSMLSDAVTTQQP